jgi:regulator of sigma E protease
MLITILSTAVVLGVLIFVHELGHFMTAKLMDIEVPRFSIGFGPKVIGFRRGETEYVLSLLPLGGYVKMAGMEEMEAIEGGGAQGTETPVDLDTPRTPGPRDFESKSVAARALVISAGVTMNVLFAFLVFAFIGLVWGVPAVPPAVVGGITEEYVPAGAEALAGIPRGSRITRFGDSAIGDVDDLRYAITAGRAGPTEIALDNGQTLSIDLPSGDSLRAALFASIEPMTENPPLIAGVLDGQPADDAGLRANDRVLSAGGTTVGTWQDFVEVIEKHAGEAVALSVERGGDTIQATVTPSVTILADGTRYGRIGVQAAASRAAVPRNRVGPISALAYGISETWQWIKVTVDFLVGMFSGRVSARNVGGPIMIGQLSGQVARAGLETVLNFMALLSVNLAVLNLLPIPVLDGGHLVFLGIEAVRGRALSLRQRMRLSQVGFIVLLAIMVFAIGNDLLRWIGL